VNGDDRIPRGVREAEVGGVAGRHGRTEAVPDIVDPTTATARARTDRGAGKEGAAGRADAGDVEEVDRACAIIVGARRSAEHGGADGVGTLKDADARCSRREQTARAIAARAADLAVDVQDDAAGRCARCVASDPDGVGDIGREGDGFNDREFGDEATPIIIARERVRGGRRAAGVNREDGIPENIILAERKLVGAGDGGGEPVIHVATTREAAGARTIVGCADGGSGIGTEIGNGCGRAGVGLPERARDESGIEHQCAQN